MFTFKKLCTVIIFIFSLNSLSIGENILDKQANITNRDLLQIELDIFTNTTNISFNPDGKHLYTLIVNDKVYAIIGLFDNDANAHKKANFTKDIIHKSIKGILSKYGKIDCETEAYDTEEAMIRYSELLAKRKQTQEQ